MPDDAKPQDCPSWDALTSQMKALPDEALSLRCKECMDHYIQHPRAREVLAQWMFLLTQAGEEDPRLCVPVFTQALEQALRDGFARSPLICIDDAITIMVFTMLNYMRYLERNNDNPGGIIKPPGLDWDDDA